MSSLPCASRIDEVFDAIHATLFRLYARGPDRRRARRPRRRLGAAGGLLQKVAARLVSSRRERPADAPKGPPILLSRKSCAHDEKLPRSWEIDGTTGYDFMDEVTRCSTTRGRAAADASVAAHQRPVGDFDRRGGIGSPPDLERSFSAQLESLCAALYEIAQAELTTRDISRPALRRGLDRNPGPLSGLSDLCRVEHASPSDRMFLSRAVARAKTTGLPSDRWLIEMLGGWLMGTRSAPDRFAQMRARRVSAIECAALREGGRGHRLLSLWPAYLAQRRWLRHPSVRVPPTEFHRRMQERATDFPHAMLATATHDHKRGEDVRARLAVLSELADEWSPAVERWVELCRPLAGRLAERRCRRGRSGDSVPDRRRRLADGLPPRTSGAWRPTPNALLHGSRKRAGSQVAQRLVGAERDRTSVHAGEFVAWLFGRTVGTVAGNCRFRPAHGAGRAVNGLAQVLLKLTAPGVPDIYQGTEYWDFSLSIPTTGRRSILQCGKARSGRPCRHFAADWADGRIKQLMMARVLAVRKKIPVFSRGAYCRCSLGPIAGHFVAFARTWAMQLSPSSAGRALAFCARIAH